MGKPLFGAAFFSPLFYDFWYFQRVLIRRLLRSIARLSYFVAAAIAAS